MPSPEQLEACAKWEAARGENRMGKEFPEYPPLEVEVRALLGKYGFTSDASWHNDACPSFSTADARWHLWVDHPDRAEREMDQVWRFLLQKNHPDGSYNQDSPDVFAVESVADLDAALAAWSATQSEGENRSLAAANKALAAHSEALGIEGDEETQVWHLIASLQEYCAVKGMDFDAQVDEVKKQIRHGDIELPAAAEKLRAETVRERCGH